MKLDLYTGPLRKLVITLQCDRVSLLDFTFGFHFWISLHTTWEMDQLALVRYSINVTCSHIIVFKDLCDEDFYYS
jgi:hypothetical protein